MLRNNYNSAIISRNIDPQTPAVITVGAVQAGIDNNVIPASATLKLNTRHFNDKDRDYIVTRINQIDSGIAVANNLPPSLYPTLVMKQRVSPLVNDAGMVTKINTVLEKYAGAGKNVQGIPPTMGSEDFQHLVSNNKIKVYDYLLVGIANPIDVAKANASGKMFPYYNHNGDFKVDLTAIPYYTSFGAVALLEMFKK